MNNQPEIMSNEQVNILKNALRAPAQNLLNIRDSEDWHNWVEIPAAYSCVIEASILLKISDLEKAISKMENTLSNINKQMSIQTLSLEKSANSQELQTELFMKLYSKENPVASTLEQEKKAKYRTLTPEIIDIEIKRTSDKIKCLSDILTKDNTDYSDAEKVKFAKDYSHYLQKRMWLTEVKAEKEKEPSKAKMVLHKSEQSRDLINLDNK